MSLDPVVLIFAPGLSWGLVEGGALPRLATSISGARRAGLVCGFPSLPASVEASALRGQSPARHRIRLSRDHASPAHPSLGERLSARREASYLDLGSAKLDPLETFEGRELVLSRQMGLMETARREGMTSLARLEAAVQLDEDLAGLHSRLPKESALVILGGPGMRPCAKRIVLPPELTGDEVQIESAILRVRPGGSSETQTLREALLRCPGVERVLYGEALESWGAAFSTETGELYALAGAGWSFEEEAASVGHPELERTEQPVLISFASSEGRGWPPELHDHRIAPTLARRFELSYDAYFDRPFPL